MNKVLAVVRREAAAAGLEPYCAARHTGLLRDLVIRRGRDPQTDAPRLLVQFVTRVAAEGVLAPLAAALAAEVLEVAGVVASVAPQRGGGGKPKGPPKLLHGEPVIMERLLGLWFEVPRRPCLHASGQPTAACSTCGIFKPQRSGASAERVQHFEHFAQVACRCFETYSLATGKSTFHEFFRPHN